MIIEIENEKGMRLGAVRCNYKKDEFEETLYVQETTNNVSIADIDYDDIFDTYEDKVRIQIEDSKLFSSNNYYGVGDVPEECRDLVKELNSYSVALKWFRRQKYNDCYIIIENHFGHINYGAEFGYFKTHEEICLILLRNLTYSLSKDGNPDSFPDFCISMMKKCIWNLENEHDYEVNKEELKKRCY